jgi:RimJ/RimL family protein N-acetyltransferase
MFATLSASLSTSFSIRTDNQKPCIIYISSIVIVIKEIVTERLILNDLQPNDHPFIFELVNSPGWLEFIGDRNIRTAEDAIAYIEKIKGNPHIMYWVVKLKADQIPAGIITLIKREYLEHYDIGFAFLPKYTNYGYSSEATRAILNVLPAEMLKDKIIAITTKKNERSINLLEKLKFRYEGGIEADGKLLLLYALSADQIQIDKITQAFFALFTNITGPPEFDCISKLCHKQAQIIKKTDDSTEIYNLQSFIEPRKKILTDGTLTGFREYEVQAETKITGQIAQRFSIYEKRGKLHGNDYSGSGNKMLHFMKHEGKWQIIHVIWEDNT